VVDEPEDLAVGEQEEGGSPVAGTAPGEEPARRRGRTLDGGQDPLLVVEEPGERRSLLASASLEGRLTLSAELREEVGDRVRFLLPPKAL